MPRRVLVLQGHPDASAPHFCHALAHAYAQAARAAGHELREVDVGRLDFPMLRGKTTWEGDSLPSVLVPAQQAIGVRFQCDINTGSVIEFSTVRVAPPSTSSRARLWP